MIRILDVVDGIKGCLPSCVAVCAADEQARWDDDATTVWILHDGTQG